MLPAGHPVRRMDRNLVFDGKTDVFVTVLRKTIRERTSRHNAIRKAPKLIERLQMFGDADSDCNHKG